MNTTTVTTPDNTPLFEAAYTATSRDRAALAPTDLLPVNLDAQSIINTVVSVMPKLKTLRPEITTRLPADDASEIDALESYAYALAHAQTTYLAASAPTEELPELAERATKLRDMLLADVKALAYRGMVDDKPLAELKGATGYLNIAYDLGVLVRMLRARWETIASKSAIQATELDEAQSIFERITLTYAERSRQSAQVAAAADERQRAFTLLVKTYDDVRRIVSYLRWSTSDADKFAPSLWAGRGSRSSSSEAPNKIDATAPTEPGPAIASTPSAPTAAAAPVGQPGSSPFVDN